MQLFDVARFRLKPEGAHVVTVTFAKQPLKKGQYRGSREPLGFIQFSCLNANVSSRIQADLFAMTVSACYWS
jgi:hypothetical protein